MRFDPFGSPLNTAGTTTPGTQQPSCNTGTTPDNFFYRAKRQDPSSGDYQLGSRLYDPAKSSFLTQDAYRVGPAAANPGIGADPLLLNTYAYVNGDPVNLSDPTGHRYDTGNSTCDADPYATGCGGPPPPSPCQQGKCGGASPPSPSPPPSSNGTGCSGPHANALGCNDNGGPAPSGSGAVTNPAVDKTGFQEPPQPAPQAIYFLGVCANDPFDAWLVGVPDTCSTAITSHPTSEAERQGICDSLNHVRLHWCNSLNVEVGPWILGVTDAGSPSLGNPASLRGLSPDQLDELIPKGWSITPSKPSQGGKGVRWFEPGTNNSSGFRWMPGSPNDPNIIKQGPYIRGFGRFETGGPIPAAGNPFLRNPVWEQLELDLRFPFRIFRIPVEE